MPSISRISLATRGLLPTTEVVQLTEECSAVILDLLPEKKKKDLGCPTIICSIRAQHFIKHTLCELGGSVSVMSKLVYDKHNHHALAPTAMFL